jgi:hypothetical protein
LLSSLFSTSPGGGVERKLNSLQNYSFSNSINHKILEA